MELIQSDKIQIAVLDLYEGEPNEGMRGIRQVIEAFTKNAHVPVDYKIFDVRLKNEVPGLEYDIYISTGGPGSPIESEGTEWEKKYFELMDSLHHYNSQHPEKKKHVLLICHSFQLYCRQYGYAKVSKRKSNSFGVMPVHKTELGREEVLFNDLSDPLWAVDSRDYQITKPNVKKIGMRGGAVLTIEKSRPHVLLERAVMAIRFDEAFVGMQFHPEADAAGILKYLLRDDKKKMVIKKHGKKKYEQMLSDLNDPEKIMATYYAIVPQFLRLGLKTQLAVVPS